MEHGDFLSVSGVQMIWEMGFSVQLIWNMGI